MAWNPLGQLRVIPRWTNIPVSPAEGTIRTGTGTARVCIEPGQRAVLQLIDVALADGTGAGLVFTAAELAAVAPLPAGVVGIVGHASGGALSTSTLKAAASLYWVKTDNGVSAPTNVRASIALRGEMTWHIG